MADYVDQVIASWKETRPDLDTTPLSVVLRLLRAATAVQGTLDSLAGSVSILSHKGDLDTLTALRRAGRKGLSPSELAAAGQMTSGGMTNRLDRLEAGGLVARSPDAVDRRSVRVKITREGEQVADSAFTRNLEAQRELLAPLTGAEQNAVAAALRKLLETLDP